MNNLPQARQWMMSKIDALNVDNLSISPYSKNALLRVTRAMEFYIDIYNALFQQLKLSVAQPIEDTILVDYGGGHGLFSAFAKYLGFKTVIYVDNNPLAVDAARAIASYLDVGPDIFVEGDVNVLKNICQANSITPHALVAVDVIEHIYILDDFFSSLNAISPQLLLLFTTASNPYNKHVVKRLHKAMLDDELGNHHKVGFRTLRRNYIQQLYPTLSNSDLDYWAENTRGLIYSDIKKSVELHDPNLLLDPFNTCDPASGSWSERILPIHNYAQLLSPYKRELQVLPGFYNEHRHGIKHWACRSINQSIRKGFIQNPRSLRDKRRLKQALKKAPFIFLIAHPTF